MRTRKNNDMFCVGVSTDICTVAFDKDHDCFVLLFSKSLKGEDLVRSTCLTRQEVTARVERWMAKYGAEELPW